MTSLSEKIRRCASEADAGTWGRAYPLFDRVIEAHALSVGVEVGVAYGGHVEAILGIPTMARLYGVDPYQHMENYPWMDFSQSEFDELYEFVLERLSSFGDRYQHIRKLSKDAIVDVPDKVDFVYVDADHSYEGVWTDLCTWFAKVRDGGIIGGHDYDHPNFPGVKKAVDRFFRRFEWEIHVEGEGVWWVERKPLRVSYVVPCYDCREFVRQSVDSIMNSNFEQGDELIIVNDCSNDDSGLTLRILQAEHPGIEIVSHTRNKGSGAAVNTAVENAHNPLIFRLDADNLLPGGSIGPLKGFLVSSGADVASFQKVRYFQHDPRGYQRITHEWIFRPGEITLADHLAGHVSPPNAQNYMFTKESWIRSGGYPEFAGAMEGWGSGIRQLVSGSKIMVMPDSYYLHRVGYESYWIRDSKLNASIKALQILLPYINLIDRNDVNYIMGPKGRFVWYDNLPDRPIRPLNGQVGKTGISTAELPRPTSMLGRMLLKARRILAMGT